MCVFEYFFREKHNSMYGARTNHIAALGYVSCINQIAALKYVSRTNQIVALYYVSRTNHIAVIGYLAPITAFGYCSVSCKLSHRIWGPCTKNDVNQKFWAYFGFI